MGNGRDMDTAQPGSEKVAGKEDLAKKIAESLKKAEASDETADIPADLSEVSFARKNTQASTAQAQEKPAAENIAKPVLQQERAGNPLRGSTQENASEKSNAKHTGKKKKKAHNKGKMIAAFTGGFVLLAALGAYVAGILATDEKLLPKTKINGVDVGMMTTEEAAAAVDKAANYETNLVFEKADGSEYTVPLSDIDFSYDTKDKVQKIADDQQHALWFVSLIQGSTNEIVPVPVYDADKLKKLIEDKDWGDTKAKDAYIEKTSSGYQIVDSEPGDEIVPETLATYTEEQLNQENFTIDMRESGCYVEAAVTAEDLQDELQKLNDLYNLTIEINFDYTTETLRGTDFMDWITPDGDSYDVDAEKVMAYVLTLSDKYDTYGKDRQFQSTERGEITVPAGSGIYGWWIDQEKTRDLLIEKIKAGESVKIDPIYYVGEWTKYVFEGNPEWRTAESDIGNTYIEIDLKKQHLWYYEEGKLKRECDIISGLPTDERNTPAGVYCLWYKERNATLTDNKTYWTTVAYWNYVSAIGIGLHDATWQSSFGGDLYKTRGSHGCINMSLNDAKYVYEKVPIGTPVVMYW